jgi:multidrug efflux pump subunit AcrB
VNGLVTSPSSGALFEVLDDFKTRPRGLTAGAIAGELNKRMAAIPDATAITFPPPAVQGLGQLGGFRMQIEDTAGLGPEALQ